MTQGNSQKLARFQQVWKELLEEVVKHDFYGVATVELKVQDGTIQAVCRKVERVEK